MSANEKRARQIGARLAVLPFDEQLRLLDALEAEGVVDAAKAAELRTTLQKAKAKYGSTWNGDA